MVLGVLGLGGLQLLFAVDGPLLVALALLKQSLGHNLDRDWDILGLHVCHDRKFKRKGTLRP